MFGHLYHTVIAEACQRVKTKDDIMPLSPGTGEITTPFLDQVDATALLADPRVTLDPDDIKGPEDACAPRISTVISHPSGAALVRVVASYSPYLLQALRRDGDILADFASSGPDAVLDDILSSLKSDAAAAGDIGLTEAMKRLRVAKRRAALCIALADISGLWSLAQVTLALSRVASATLELALATALSDVSGAPKPLGSGVTILGMGKLGAEELNYSSDIDIIVLYDPNSFDSSIQDRLRQDMVRATRTLMRLMDERTADGYVFRTDLRLRPDPGMTPLAMTVGAAETYYESVGQNWERAAMIKARPVAGDIALGSGFLSHIRPFVWRKHLDFAAIQDIHSIKRQINAFRGGGTVAIEGHNIKIGRGGIREIEFFTQTQQLIWGGRQANLRSRRTLEALAALVEAGHVRPETLADMSAAYRFLRTLEHRLQMVNDEQTHVLPSDANGLERIARFTGFPDIDGFKKRLLEILLQVEGHYAALFEEAPDLGGGGALVFTGSDDDPDTLENLSSMGFKDPSRVAARVRVWHHGRYRAMRSERARQILTELMPKLLDALAKAADPDDAFIRFDAFLEGLPAGVQLFSLFQAQPQLLGLVTEVLGNAPRLADWMARKPILLDAVMSDDFFDPEEPAELMRENLAAQLSHADHYEAVLDGVRRWTNDKNFQIGVQILKGIADGSRVGETISDVAETALAAIEPAVVDLFEEAHGRVPGEGFAIIAFGKLGGRELLHRSDLDLVFVYDVAADVVSSDGPKPLGPAVYYLRLCQRLVTAIASDTAEGKLFEVDNRLRPAGRSGPLATQLETFEAYYRQPDGEAWTWEYMALSRARVISGSPALRSKLEAGIRDALRQPRDGETLLTDVFQMRGRIKTQYPGNDPWDIKHRSGGLVDLEFITQYLCLLNAPEHPEILLRNTGATLDALFDAALMPEHVHTALGDALTLWRRLQAVIRLTSEAGFDPETAPAGQRHVLAVAAGERDFETLAERVEETAAKVADCYRSLIVDPAEEISTRAAS